MSWIVICCGAKGCGKSEQQRQELGMTVEDYRAFCKEQAAAWKERCEASKVLEEASRAYSAAAMRYLQACIIPEKYQK